MNRDETVATYSEAIMEARRANRPVSFPYMRERRQYTADVIHVWEEESEHRFLLVLETVDEEGIRTESEGHVSAHGVALAVWELQTELRESMQVMRLSDNPPATIDMTGDLTVGLPPDHGAIISLPRAETTRDVEVPVGGSMYVMVDDDPPPADQIVQHPQLTVESVTETTDLTLSGLRTFSVTVHTLSANGTSERHTLTYPPPEFEDFPNSDRSPHGTVFAHPGGDYYILHHSLWRAIPSEVFDDIDFTSYIELAPNVWLPTRETPEVLREDGGPANVVVDGRPAVVQEAYPDGANYHGIGGGHTKGANYRCPMCQGCQHVEHYINCAMHPLGPADVDNCADYRPKAQETDLWFDLEAQPGSVDYIQIPDGYYDEHGRCYEFVDELPPIEDASHGDRVVVFGVPYVFSCGQWAEITGTDVDTLRAAAAPTEPRQGQLFEHGGTVYRWNEDTWTHAEGKFILRGTGVQPLPPSSFLASGGYSLDGVITPFVDGSIAEYEGTRWKLQGQVWCPLPIGSIMYWNGEMHMWNGSEFIPVYGDLSPITNNPNDGSSTGVRVNSINYCDND